MEAAFYCCSWSGWRYFGIFYILFSSHITPLNISVMIFKLFRTMPSKRRGKRANQMHSFVNTDVSGGSAEVKVEEEAGVESKYVIWNSDPDIFPL